MPLTDIAAPQMMPAIDPSFLSVALSVAIAI
jgi:hypothetical protein